MDADLESAQLKLSQRPGPHGVCGDLALPLTQPESPTATGPHRDLARGLLSHGLLSGDQALLPTQLESPTATGPHRALMAKGLLVRRPQLRHSIPMAAPLMLVRLSGDSQ